MENFNVGEIIWAKIRGYPWWPATITGTKDDSREKIYRVSFIGDKTFANLPKKFLAKFEKEYKTYSNTKQKKLVESIKEAKKLYNSKAARNSLFKDKKKGDNDDEDSYEEEDDDNNSISSSEDNEEEEDNSSFLNKKRKKSINNSVKGKKTAKPKIAKINSSSLVNIKEKNVIEIIRKIISYLIYIAKIIEKKEDEKLKEENECLMKVLEFLRDYKMTDPIDFLKKTKIGQLIKYINTNINHDALKQFSGEVYKSLEDQVITQLFPKTK